MHVRLAGDRFLVVWSDPRNDANPDTCDRTCQRDVYLSAYDTTDGSSLVTERRLTTTSQRIDDVRVAYLPEADRILVTWLRNDTSAGTDPYSLHGVVVDRTGRTTLPPVRLDPPPTSGNRVLSGVPHPDGDHWLLLYLEGGSSSISPTYLRARTFAPDGTLGPPQEPTLRVRHPTVPARRLDDGRWATLTAETSPNGIYLRWWDSTTWEEATRRVLVPLSVHQPRMLAWDGVNFYGINGPTRQYDLIRLNSDGIETGRIALDQADDSFSNRLWPRFVRHVAGRVVAAWVEVLPDSTRGRSGRARYQIMDVRSDF